MPSPVLFAVLAQGNAEVIGQALKAKYTGEVYDLAHGQWLLAAPGKTTKEIAEEIGVSANPSIGSAVVLAFASYYGRANPQIWEWIKSRLG